MGALMGSPVLRFAASPFPTHRAKIQPMTERDSSFEAIYAVQRSAKRCRLNNVIRDPLLACSTRLSSLSSSLSASHEQSSQSCSQEAIRACFRFPL